MEKLNRRFVFIHSSCGCIRDKFGIWISDKKIQCQQPYITHLIIQKHPQHNHKYALTHEAIDTSFIHNANNECTIGAGSGCQNNNINKWQTECHMNESDIWGKCNDMTDIQTATSVTNRLYSSPYRRQRWEYSSLSTPELCLEPYEWTSKWTGI